MKPADRDSLDFATETSTTSSQDVPDELSHIQIPGLVIVAHPDPRRIGEESPLAELTSGQTVGLSRRHPRFLPPGTEVPPRSLEDSRLSRRPLLLARGPSSGEVTLERQGSPISVLIGGQPLGEKRTFTLAELERGVVLLLAGHIALLLTQMPAMPMQDGARFGLIGHSSAMVRLRREIRAAAMLEVPVLVRGETGTGKELVSRAIHDAGGNRGPYLAVNLGALVPALAASELFGATRGAYTGADRGRQGFFRRADGGTLFLDEIGEAPLEVQVMLLRTLETGRVQAVGGAEETAVKVRIIAATDADLETAIAGGRFRSALLHRLAGYEIRVPPLRERRDDIARLLHYFLGREAESLSGVVADATAWPSASVTARLVEHDWPGNVRELRNVARRLAVLRHVEGITDAGPLLDHLLRPAQAAETAVPEPIPAAATPEDSRRRRWGSEVEANELLEALEANTWRPGPSAAALGISRPTLYRLIDDHPDLRKASEIDRDELHQALREHGSISSAARVLKVSPQGLKRRLTSLGLAP